VLYDPKWGVETKTLEPWQRILYAAADLIEEHGWCQHVPRDSHGHICVFTALLTDAPADAWRACQALERYCGLTKPYYVTRWNDMPGRTKDEVLNALRGAATFGVANQKESGDVRL
jgi:hypothetical protein